MRTPEDPPIPLELELAYRLADVAAVLAGAAVSEDGELLEEDGHGNPGLLSALEHALTGSSGCVEPDEWQALRERALAEHAGRLGLETGDVNA